MRRLWLALLVLPSAALATGEHLEFFKAHYGLKDGSAILSKSCGACHISDSDFRYNPYGADLKSAMEKAKTKTLAAAFLDGIGEEDSDKDGNPNQAEIAGDTLPGDAKSGAKKVAPAEALPPPVEKKPFPPKTGYHPAVVHFPIALFIGGLILDLLGTLRKDKSMMQAGWYCVTMAAISSLASIATGMWAMQLQKLPYRGLLLEHVGYAAGATVAMWGMVGLRIHQHEQMSVGRRGLYVLLALACLGAITWAGHLGGVFVYGE